MYLAVKLPMDDMERYRGMHGRLLFSMSETFSCCSDEVRL